MVQFLVFHYWLKFKSKSKIGQKVGTVLKYTSLNGHKSNKRKRKPNKDDVSKMLGLQGSTTNKTARTFSLDNQINTRLPLIQALVDRQDVHSNMIWWLPDKNLVPGEQNQPNRICLSDKNKVPGKLKQPNGIRLPNKNIVPGKLKPHTANTQLPGEQLLKHTNAYMRPFLAKNIDLVTFKS